MVGNQAYGEGWVEPHVIEAGLRAGNRTNADHCRALAVAEDLRLAGASGVIQTAVVIEIPPRPLVKVPKTETVDLLADDDDEEDPVPVGPRHYRLLKGFWDKDWQTRMQDWRASLFAVPLRDLGNSVGNPFGRIVPDARSLLSSRPDLHGSNAFPITGRIEILQAEKAIRGIHKLGSLPDKFWRDRSRTYPNRLVDEVVLAAWRRLAIENYPKDKLSTSLIRQLMLNYLDMHSIDGDKNGLSDQTLDAIARKILNQSRSRDFSSVALMNSTAVKK